MSIIISELNESLGKSFLKQTNTYLKGKSTIDEYELGREMSEDLSEFSKLLKCSESSVVYLSENDVSGKSKKLWDYIMSSLTKSIKKIKLSDEESVANLYSVDSCLVIVADVEYSGKYIVYNAKDEMKFSDNLNESLEFINEANLPAIVPNELAAVPKSILDKTAKSATYLLDASSEKIAKICFNIARNTKFDADFSMRDPKHYKLELKVGIPSKNLNGVLRVFNNGNGNFLETQITRD